MLTTNPKVSIVVEKNTTITNISLNNATFTLYVDPLKLWTTFEEDLSEDIRHANQDATDDQVRNNVLIVLADKLATHNKTLKDFTLPEPDRHNDLPRPEEKEVNEALDYDADDLKETLRTDLPKLTSEQKEIFDHVTNWDGEGAAPLIFVDAPGGTGKTFLLKVLIAYFRSQKKVVLPLASTGLASLLLPGGRTVHSTFKVPLLPDPEMTCNVPKRKSARAELIKKCALYVWDESTMLHRHVVESVERCMKDLTDSDKCFAGVPVVLGMFHASTHDIICRPPDFRQEGKTFKNIPFCVLLLLHVEARINHLFPGKPSHVV